MKKREKTLLFSILGVFGVLILLQLTVFAIWGVPNRLPGTLTTTELEAKVVGKTPEEVIKLVGRPRFTANNDTSWCYWAFNEISQRSSSVFIRFRDGKAVSVEK